MTHILNIQTRRYQENRGRIEIMAMVMRLGRDLQIVIYGGDAHIGAAAVASPETMLFAGGLPGHREKEIAATMAGRLARSLGCNVCVSAGIHFDGITKAEIGDVLVMCAAITDKITSSFSGEAKMIDLAQIEEFEKYIKSGALERDFLNSGEYERHYTLELLEKIMDLADLADEAATRLIFRGLPPVEASKPGGRQGNGMDKNEGA